MPPLRRLCKIDRSAGKERLYRASWGFTRNPRSSRSSPRSSRRGPMRGDVSPQELRGVGGRHRSASPLGPGLHRAEARVPL